MIYFRPTLYRHKGGTTLYVSRPVPARLVRIARFLSQFRPVRETFIPGIYLATDRWQRDFYTYYEPIRPSALARS